jgi:uridylate kinase
LQPLPRNLRVGADLAALAPEFELMAKPAATAKLPYRRVLLKLSGEALAGAKGYGIDLDVLAPIARDIARTTASGVEICLVVGGGNIFRGLMASEAGMDRARADYMGMLATVMNALALQTAIEREGVSARVLSAIPMPTVCESYIRDKALDHLDKGRVVIFAGGTGNPFFTTDTAATLRAAEMGCEALFKGTQVDGVYESDPKKVPNSRRFDRLTYDEVLKQDLRVMDGAAIALARDNRIPIIVFSIKSQGGLAAVLQGKGSSTTIDAGA